MNKNFTFYLTVISWVFVTGLYYLLVFYGTDSWPAWADSNFIIYGSWVLFGVLLGGIHGIFFKLSGNSRLRRSSYGVYLSIQLVFITGLFIFSDIMFDSIGMIPLRGKENKEELFTVVE